MLRSKKKIDRFTFYILVKENRYVFVLYQGTVFGNENSNCKSEYLRNNVGNLKQPLKIQRGLVGLQ